MAFSFLVTAREGLEMALIIIILLGYLRSIGHKQHFKQIWYGAGAAAALSIAFGAVLEVASQELDGRILEAFEGFTMLFAVAVLTWMLFWMKRQSAGMSREMKGRIDSALSQGSVMALTALSFSSVGREGFETALFLFAGSSNTSTVGFLTGGIAGFGVAGVAGVVLYYGAARLPLRQFFLVSGIGLMILAAGLLTNALTSLHGATVVSDLGPRPWDTESLIASTSSLGKFLHTLLGYDSAPAISQIVLYWSYLAAVLSAYLAWPALARLVRRRGPAEDAVTAS